MTSRTPLTALVVGLLALVVAAPAQAADTWTAQLSGANELPARDTAARGTAVVQLSPDGTELTYRLIVANIDNVVASHIHVGTADVNGPVVAFLFGNVGPAGGTSNGVIATGTITADDLIGPLSGQSLQALVAAIEADGAYVNVHTNDGVDPINTGAGDFPGGEIRGQLG
jgi:hypothetical protein